MMNIQVLVTPDELALIESLNKARITANALGGYHERQAGGTYGAVASATTIALTAAIATQQVIFWPEARMVAERILEEVVDNGENVTYNIDLWNKNVIHPWTF